ncbi:MAG: hypothetical protein M1820_001226 [Bogoriella megaspora]|nr:MAG: hypothetical protein M1820_001226 [Bogoriella megaspora]
MAMQRTSKATNQDVPHYVGDLQPYNKHQYGKLAKRIQECSRRLFCDESKARVIFWETCGERRDFISQTLVSYEGMLQRLRSLEWDPGKSPLCRFVFIEAKHSRAELYITEQMLMSVLIYHQVSPWFLEFLMIFGKREKATEAKFGGFRCEIAFGARSKHVSSSRLGQPKSGFRLCYSLSSAEESESNTSRPWSIRQTVVYHSFDSDTGCSTWIVVKGNSLIRTRVVDQGSVSNPDLPEAHKSPAASFAASLFTHLVISDWSGEEWRWYITYLEGEMEKTTDHTKTANPDLYQYTFAELQRCENLLEKVEDALFICRTNVRVLSELNSFYVDQVGLQGTEEPTIHDSEQDIRQFSRRVRYIVEDLRLQVARLESLLRLLTGRKSLLLSSLEYQNAQASNKMAQEAHLSAVRMERLTEQMNLIARRTEQETVTMRIIALVAIFFLPGTFITASASLVLFGGYRPISSAVKTDGERFGRADDLPKTITEFDLID